MLPLALLVQMQMLKAGALKLGSSPENTLFKKFNTAVPASAMIEKFFCTYSTNSCIWLVMVFNSLFVDKSKSSGGM